MLTWFLGWVLNTVTTAAEAEMNDDTALREQLLEAELRREMGEISDEEFTDIEADLLARIREIRERREGGSGPISMSGGEPIETTGEGTFQVEASVSGDFHEPATAPHTTVIQSEPDYQEKIAVLDMEPGPADPRDVPSPRTTRTTRTSRTNRTNRTSKIRES